MIDPVTAIKYLAWVILGSFYLFGIVPLLGTCFTSTTSGYLEDFIVGFITHILIFGIIENIWGIDTTLFLLFG